jgi:hypothetical protein
VRFVLQRVTTIPRELDPHVLYVAETFGAAAHLCACGCGTKIRTPLGPTDWYLTDTRRGPTLRPSIGNWQEACQSHYLIIDGEVRWARQWTQEEILVGRAEEQTRAHAYYEHRDQHIANRLGRWLRGLVHRISAGLKNRD